MSIASQRITENSSQGLRQQSKPFIIYAYRLTSDSGNAPCIHDLDGNPTGILTLACCKGGQIRNKKDVWTGLRHTIGKAHKDAIDNNQIDIYLMGLYKKTLVYVALITDILSMEDYYTPNSQYKHRMDYIYNFVQGKLKRNGNNPDFHNRNETGQHRRDRLGKYVLISTHFAYWGRNGIELPEDFLKILPKFRETKSYDNSSPNGNWILSIIGKRWNFKDIIQNEPRHPNKTYQRKGCTTK